MTDYQGGVPVRGDYVFHANTWHSIELSATMAVPEWGGQEVRFALEEDAALLDPGAHRLNVRVDGGPWRVPRGTRLEADEFGTAAGIIVIR